MVVCEKKRERENEREKESIPDRFYALKAGIVCTARNNVNNNINNNKIIIIVIVR